ncbi:MAG: C40 family peptidase [Actinomycetaceae bacterium]|nr:C40 family peptidase [Actinomycetaceae bacterium]
MVNYACQFSGVPYVWGGNGPSGWDCSGFTAYVYRHFGINMPRYSGAQHTVGYEVSRVDARPDDLM